MAMKKVRKAVLPVAGLGTRFLPATKAMPKEMLTVVDKPLIQYAVEEALAAGIEEFIFITGRGKSAIENHFDKPYELGHMLEQKGKTEELDAVMNILPENTRISYIRQGEPLGLGHAVWCAQAIIGDEPFAVLLPDDIIYGEDEVPLKGMVSAYEKTGKPVVMSQEVPLDRTRNYGILDIGDNTFNENGEISVNGFVEKPMPEKAPSTCAVVGRYILTPRIFDFLAEKEVGAGGEIQLTDAMTKLCAEQGFQGYLLNGIRFDCGDKVGFQKANLFFALKDKYIGPRLLDFVREMTDENLLKTA
jgi:UTP--glucose-1-phosphate uridylyltransferase